MGRLSTSSPSSSLQQQTAVRPVAQPQKTRLTMHKHGAAAAAATLPTPADSHRKGRRADSLVQGHKKDRTHRAHPLSCWSRTAGSCLPHLAWASRQRMEEEERHPQLPFQPRRLDGANALLYLSSVSHSRLETQSHPISWDWDGEFPPSLPKQSASEAQKADGQLSAWEAPHTNSNQKQCVTLPKWHRTLSTHSSSPAPLLHTSRFQLWPPSKSVKLPKLYIFRSLHAINTKSHFKTLKIFVYGFQTLELWHEQTQKTLSAAAVSPSECQQCSSAAMQLPGTRTPAQSNTSPGDHLKWDTPKKNTTKPRPEKPQPEKPHEGEVLAVHRHLPEGDVYR